jgi:hypothetical protein
MYRAQGTQPEPHQILQIHPAAPGALVVDAFMALTRRPWSRTPSASAYLRAVQAAYRHAMALRVSGDPPRPEGSGCHYAALCLDTSADQEIVQLAFQTLERVDPQPHHSLGRYLRHEALRILSNPQLRARYDGDRSAATLGTTGRATREIAKPVNPPRKDVSVPTNKKRGLFGLGRARASAAEDSIDARLLDLRSRLPLSPEEDRPDQVDLPLEALLPMAEIVFTAGPRAGMRADLDGNVVPMGEGKSSATIWRHGERFLIRHNGARVLVSNRPPVLPIVVLEDGDEIVVGADHARFRILPPLIPS